MKTNTIHLAAMTTDHFLDDVEDGLLIVTPGDRCDILNTVTISAVPARGTDQG